MSDNGVTRIGFAAEYESLTGEGALFKFLARIMASHETMVKMVIGTNEQLIAELESRRVNDALIEQRRLELYAHVEESLSLKSQREIKERQEALKEKVAQELVGDFKALLGPIINKIAGTPMIRQDDRHSLKTFLSELNEGEQEAMQAFLGKLSHAKRMALITMIESIDDDEKAKADKAKEETIDGS